jgi:hypothetical protein
MSDLLARFQDREETIYSAELYWVRFGREALEPVRLAIKLAMEG